MFAKNCRSNQAKIVVQAEWNHVLFFAAVIISSMERQVVFGLSVMPIHVLLCLLHSPAHPAFPSRVVQLHIRPQSQEKISSQYAYVF